MYYLPIFLSLKGRHCLIVGGGIVAFRKVKPLLKAHAHVTVIAKDISSDLKQLAHNNNALMLIESEITADAIADYYLVIAATSNRHTNRFIAGIANQHNIPVNAVDDPDNSSFIQPAIVNRSPIMIAISSGGAAPVLARRIRQMIETFLPTNIGKVAAHAKTLRTNVKSLKFKNPRAFWEKLFDSHYSHQIMAGNMQQAEQIATQIMAKPETKVGMVYLAGAGPGDPNLLTLKALNTLHQADVILHDQLVSEAVLAYARRDAEFISVGKSASKPSTSQATINDLMIKYAKKGLIVCRLKGGDPFIFGRGGEEMQYLKAHDIPYEIVPGITSAVACAAYASIPLTHRDLAQSVTFITAQQINDLKTNFIPLARKNQTLAIYMGLNAVQHIQKQLLTAGYSPQMPIAIIEKGTTPEQRTVTGTLNQLATLAHSHQIESPAMIIVGEVAKLSNEYQWFNQKIGEPLQHEASLA